MRKSAWSRDNVGGLGEYLTCHMFWFLSLPFLFLGSLPARTGQAILTDFDNLQGAIKKFCNLAIQHITSYILSFFDIFSCNVNTHFF